MPGRKVRTRLNVVFGTKGSTGLMTINFSRKLAYASRWFPSYAWQRLTRRPPHGIVHLIFALADHFEPGFVPGDGQARLARLTQRRLWLLWCVQCVLARHQDLRAWRFLLGSIEALHGILAPLPESGRADQEEFPIGYARLRYLVSSRLRFE